MFGTSTLHHPFHCHLWIAFGRFDPGIQLPFGGVWRVCFRSLSPLLSPILTPLSLHSLVLLLHHLVYLHCVASHSNPAARLAGPAGRPPKCGPLQSEFANRFWEPWGALLDFPGSIFFDTSCRFAVSSKSENHHFSITCPASTVLYKGSEFSNGQSPSLGGGGNSKFYET